jgi:hypothetical protein
VNVDAISVNGKSAPVNGDVNGSSISAKGDTISVKGDTISVDSYASTRFSAIIDTGTTYSHNWVPNSRLTILFFVTVSRVERCECERWERVFLLLRRYFYFRSVAYHHSDCGLTLYIMAVPIPAVSLPYFRIGIQFRACQLRIPRLRGRGCGR